MWFLRVFFQTEFHVTMQTLVTHVWCFCLWHFCHTLVANNDNIYSTFMTIYRDGNFYFFFWNTNLLLCLWCKWSCLWTWSDFSSDNECLFQYVGTEFICAVQPILKEKWTAELEQAWKVKDTDGMIFIKSLYYKVFLNLGQLNISLAFLISQHVILVQH